MILSVGLLSGGGGRGVNIMVVANSEDNSTPKRKISKNKKLLYNRRNTEINEDW